MLSVLIIDDSLTMRKMLTGIFEDMHFNVLSPAGSAQEGIEKYNQNKPDFVTMDVNMPGMSGIEALKIIRGQNKDANVFMLTSRGDNESVIEAIKYGAKGYILKPLNVNKIKESILALFPNAFGEVSQKEVDDELNIQHCETSIKDPVTDFYTVQYMHHTAEHLIALHNMNDNIPIALMVIKINNLNNVTTEADIKKRNSCLKEVSNAIKLTTRACDIAVKLSEVEFAVFLVGTQESVIKETYEKLKSNLNELKNKKIETQTGWALHNKNEKLIAFIERADKTLKS